VTKTQISDRLREDLWKKAEPKQAYDLLNVA
jgi:hypothetical protein